MIASLKSRIASWWRRNIADLDHNDPQTKRWVEGFDPNDDEFRVLASGGRLP